MDWFLYDKDFRHERVKKIKHVEKMVCFMIPKQTNELETIPKKNSLNRQNWIRIRCFFRSCGDGVYYQKCFVLDVEVSDMRYQESKPLDRQQMN